MHLLQEKDIRADRRSRILLLKRRNLPLPRRMPSDVRRNDGARSSNPIEATILLFEEHIPDNTVLSIEEHGGGRMPIRFVFRLEYTSKNSGRKMNVTAKGDTLPSELDSLFDWYLRQLVLTPAEIGREFSRLYWYEKRAKQEAFLQGDRSVTVADKIAHKDALEFKGYY